MRNATNTASASTGDGAHASSAEQPPTGAARGARARSGGHAGVPRQFLVLVLVLVVLIHLLRRTAAQTQYAPGPGD